MDRPTDKAAHETRLAGAEADRQRKAAFFPFGGGLHLCPGRNFAFAEILGLMSVLVTGFDIEPVGMKFEEMQMMKPQLASATVRPVNMAKAWEAGSIGGRVGKE